MRRPFPSKMNDDTILKQDKQERVWFCITTLRDWLKKLALLCRPIGSKTSKSSRDALAHVFPRLASASTGIQLFAEKCDLTHH